MKMPNAESAIIAPEKLRDYLLNPEHTRGAAKAALLRAFGYEQAHWRRLELDLRQQHLPLDISRVLETTFGVRYDIIGSLITPSGRFLWVRSIWQVDVGTNVPRFITLVPE